MNGVRQYLGIPYAEPPIRDLRWKPPVKKARFEQEFVANAFGPACVQNQPQLSKTYTLPANITQSEDCLTLNIWAAEDISDAPVFFWIHGGSLTIGSSSEPMYNGANLADRGMVVVTINYRLGAFGWLAHPELSAEQGGISGNYGLLDQICALEWVRDNIAEFGGDPTNVTLAGESAGALSAMYLMACPRARGLFHKVIAQSPYMISTPTLNEEKHGHVSAECAGAAFAASAGAGSISELRAMDAKELMLAATRHGFAPWGAVDGELLPDQLISVFSRGEQAQVPILTGFNQGEIRSLRALAPPAPDDPAAYEQMIRTRYDQDAEEFLRIYPSSNVEESILATTRDAMYGWSSRKLAEAQSASGQDAFLYFWNHGYSAAEAKGMHAFHASEVPFVFDNIDQTGPCWPKVPSTAEQRTMARVIGDYWTSFATFSVPTSEVGPGWKPLHSRGNCHMHFSGEPRLEECRAGRAFDFHDSAVRARQLAGEVPWNWNVGLWAPE